MDSNIKQIVKIINEIGTIEVLLDRENNSLIYDDIFHKKSEYETTINNSFKLICALFEEQRRNVNDGVIESLLNETKNIILLLKKKFFEIRKNYLSPVSKEIKYLLTAIEFKIGILNQLIDFFEFEKKYNLKNDNDNLSYNSSIEKEETKPSKHNLSTRFELLKQLEIINIITSLKCSQGYKNKILSIIMEIHVDSAKNLINGTYKWSVPADEQKIIDDILKNIN